MATSILGLLCCCHALAMTSAVAASSQNTLVEARALKQEPDEPHYVPWSPAPEYASKTWDHKTMYLVDITIGSAGQSLRMLVDTGSWMVVVPSSACKHKGCLGHRGFDTSNSTAGHQAASVNFAQGSVSGHVFSDVICAGSRSVHLKEIGFLQRRTSRKHRSHDNVDRVADGSTCAQMSFLVADDESADFSGAPYDGILGLGLQGAAPDRGVGMDADRFSFLRQLANQERLPDSVVVLRLGNEGKSELILGGVDEETLMGGQFLWVPLSPAADGHWQISVSDLTLNGVLQNAGGMEVIVDSGTSLLAPDKELEGWFKERLTPRSCSSVNDLPLLGLRLPSGNTLTMLPSDYIDRIDGKCTLAVMPMGDAVAAQRMPPRLILGDTFLRRFTTAFDLHHRRLGFGVAPDAEMAKEMAAALFPSMPTESFDKVAPSVQNLEAPSAALHAMHGLAAHLTGGRFQKRQKEISKKTTAAPSEEMPVDEPLSAEEQAGYDFVRHLSGARKLDESIEDVHDKTQQLHAKVLNQPKKAHITEDGDGLNAAADNLDNMLNGLKPHTVPEQNKLVSSHADVVQQSSVTLNLEKRESQKLSNTKAVKAVTQQNRETLKATVKVPHVQHGGKLADVKLEAAVPKADDKPITWWPGVAAAASADVKQLDAQDRLSPKETPVTGDDVDVDEESEVDIEAAETEASLVDSISRDGSA